MTKARIRILFVVTALVMASAAISQNVRLEANRRRLIAVVDSTGIADAVPTLENDLRREMSRNRANQRVARALLSSELDRGSAASPLNSPLGDAESLDRLQRAAELAADVLARRPASWQAAMVLGASHYLAASRSRTAASGASLESWQSPLQQARKLAPSQPEPARLLAAAYVGNWSHLSPETRTAARPAIEAAFRDPDSFDLLLEQWLRVVPSLEEGLSVIPRQPVSWKLMQRYYARLLDWERYCLATEGLYEVLGEALEERLSTAETMLRTGEVRDARRILLTIPLDAPPSHRFAPYIESVLNRLPSGPVQPHMQRAFRGWLDWALSRCLYDSCVIGGRELSRLARLSEVTEAHDVAFAALAAGDTQRANLYSGRATLEEDPVWYPFHLLGSRILVAQRDREGARRELDRIPAEARSKAIYRWLDDNLQPASSRRSPGRTSWSSSDWDRSNERFYRLELLTSRSAAGFEIEASWLPADGCVIELRLDGRVIDWQAVYRKGVLRLEAPVTAGLHLLEVAILQGRPFAVGDVSLVDPR